MRRPNFLETVGIIALATPLISAVVVSVLVSRGVIKVYTETSK